MMYAVTLLCAVAFSAWLIRKGLHWYDREWAETEWPVAE